MTVRLLAQRFETTPSTAPVACVLGECPRWDRDGWWWIDAATGGLRRSSAGGRRTRLVAELGSRTPFVQPLGGREEDELLIGIDAGLDLFHPETGARRRWAELPLHAQEVLNDGIADPQGGIWIGAVALNSQPGALIRVSPDGRATRVADGFTMSNGLSWSVDGTALFHADTGTGTIWRHDIAPDRTAPARSTAWLRIDAALGAPDGLAGDADGGLWVAVYGGGEVRRYDADGRCTHVVDVPTAEVTAIEFGGTGLTDLFITTASEGPLAGADGGAGHAYHAVVDVPGLPRPRGRISA